MSEGSEKGFFSKILGFLKKHIKLIIILVIIVIVAIVVKIKVIDPKKAAAEAETNQVFTTELEKMDLQDTISVTGTLAAVDSASVTSTATNVKVEKIYYEVGDYVEEGETIVEFESDDYEQKLAELNAQYNIDSIKSQRTVDLDNQTIDNTMDEIEEYKEKIADDEEDIAKWNEYLEKYKDVYNNLKDIYEQMEKYPEDEELQERYSTETDAASKLGKSYGTTASLSDYENVQNKVEDLEDDIETQNKNIKEAMQKIESQEYDIALTELQESYDKTYTQSDAINDVYEQIDATKVVAPFSGYITNINVTEGNNYTQGSTVFNISDVSSFVVEGSVDEYDISSLSTGQKAVVKFDATDDEEFTGEVTYVGITPPTSTSSSSATASTSSSSSSSSSSSYTIKIALDTADSRLRVGMTAKASVILESVEDVFAVAYDCVSEDRDGNSYITVVDDENNETRINVTVGMETDYYVEISGADLTEGMKVKATASSGSDRSSSDFPDMGGDMGGGPDGGNGGGPGGGGPGGGF